MTLLTAADKEVSELYVRGKLVGEVLNPLLGLDKVPECELLVVGIA